MGLDEGSMAEAGSGMLSRLLKPSLLLRALWGLSMLLSCISRFKCSKLRGGVGDRGDSPVVKEFGGGDCVAMTGISPDVDVGVGVVLVEYVSPLEPEFGPAEGAVGLVELVRETALFVER
jgi:hypothetical protein